MILMISKSGVQHSTIKQVSSQLSIQSELNVTLWLHKDTTFCQKIIHTSSLNRWRAKDVPMIRTKSVYSLKSSSDAEKLHSVYYNPISQIYHCRKQNTCNTFLRHDTQFTIQEFKDFAKVYRFHNQASLHRCLSLKGWFSLSKQQYSIWLNLSFC